MTINRLIIFLALILKCFTASGKIHNKIFDVSHLNILPHTIDIPLIDDQNKLHYLSSYDKNTILLFFWSTWSQDSVCELQALDKLQKEWRKLPFKIIPIAEDSLSRVKPLYKKFNIRHLPIMIDVNNQLFHALNVNIVPTSLVIDQAGQLMLKIIGINDWRSQKMRNILLKYLD